jgi:hypothetical protein
MLWSIICIIWLCFESKNANFLADFFGRNIFKITSSVPEPNVMNFKIFAKTKLVKNGVYDSKQVFTQFTLHMFMLHQNRESFYPVDVARVSAARSVVTLQKICCPRKSRIKTDSGSGKVFTQF